MAQGALEDLWSGPDYTGQFDSLIKYYDSQGDFGGNAVRYAIFSTLNDGPESGNYRQAIKVAQEKYGLRGPWSTPEWEAGGNPTDTGVIMTDYAENVVQPIVGSWLSLASWLSWFKVGFSGF